MVKQQKPASPQPDEAQGTGHPLLKQMTQVDRFVKSAADRKAAEEFQIKELEQWKIAVKALASTDYGLLFLQCMVQHSGMFSRPSYKDTMKMVDVRLKSAFYLECVRPFLEPEMRKDIE